MSADTVMREAFEEDAMLSFRPGTSISRDVCGEYEDSTVADHWETWQTAWVEAVKSAPVASGWVSVDERLPGFDEEVLIFPPPTDYIVTGHYANHAGVTWWFYSDYEPRCGHVDYGLGTERVTHWMPLPAPPGSVK